MPVSQVPFAGISNPVDFRNIVINGDMQIAQRATSQATAGSSGGSYQVLDRWKFFNNNLGAFTWSQSTDVPTGQGFANSLKLDCTTADASPAAGDYLTLAQLFEGQNLQYLKKGTANASPLTASFWVKSTKTGTFILELVDENNTRSISKSYTVSVTNTWEYKTVTFAGDTTGTLTNNNSSSLYLQFWLGAGSTYSSGTLATSWGTQTSANRAVGQVNIADSTANDFYITGVQLEAGEQASGFEFMPIDVNLTRCMRYFTLGLFGDSDTAVGGFRTTSSCQFVFKNQTRWRSTPTATLRGLTAHDLNDGDNLAFSSVSVNNTTGYDSVWLSGTVATTGTVAGVAIVYGSGASKGVELNAEL
jgi:hypothetical protein